MLIIGIITQQCEKKQLISCYVGVPSSVCLTADDGYHRHPSDGRWFYTCVGMAPQCLPCPAGLYFHRLCNTCLGKKDGKLKPVLPFHGPEQRIEWKMW